MVKCCSPSLLGMSLRTPRMKTPHECQQLRLHVWGLLESILRRHLVVLGASTVELFSQRLLHLGVDILL